MESSQSQTRSKIEMPKLRILLTGTTGQVGFELLRSLSKLAEVIACDRTQLDLTDVNSIRAVVQNLKPNLIVNAAAYTAVDRAESEPELAIAINQIAPQVLAEEAAKLNIGLIHYSTDYVFDGKLNRPYSETDQTNPLGIYGKTKLAGEEAIIAVGIPHLILRTSWVYGDRGKNFMLTMLRLAREKQELRIVADQIGAPTWCRLIAETTANVIQTMQQESAISSQVFTEEFTKYSGIYHLTNSGETSWYQFAKAIFAADPQVSEQILEKIIPISTTDYPTPTQRPANSRLNLDKLSQTFNLTLPNWEISLNQAISSKA